MKIDEFLEALTKVKPRITALQLMTATDYDANAVADLMILLTVNGLVLVPVDPESTIIPQPICYTVNFPSPDSKVESTWQYLMPADQVDQFQLESQAQTAG